MYSIGIVVTINKENGFGFISPLNSNSKEDWVYFKLDVISDDKLKKNIKVGDEVAYKMMFKMAKDVRGADTLDSEHFKKDKIDPADGNIIKELKTSMFSRNAKLSFMHTTKLKKIEKIDENGQTLKEYFDYDIGLGVLDTTTGDVALLEDLISKNSEICLGFTSGFQMYDKMGIESDIVYSADEADFSIVIYSGKGEYSNKLYFVDDVDFFEWLSYLKGLKNIYAFLKENLY